jgi:hypothetical protein
MSAGSLNQISTHSSTIVTIIHGSRVQRLHSIHRLRSCPVSAACSARSARGPRARLGVVGRQLHVMAAAVGDLAWGRFASAVGTKAVNSHVAALPVTRRRRHRRSTARPGGAPEKGRAGTWARTAIGARRRSAGAQAAVGARSTAEGRARSDGGGGYLTSVCVCVCVWIHT